MRRGSDRSRHAVEWGVWNSDVVDNASTLAADIAALHLLLREQQQVFESLQANLRPLLK